ncbi:MAG: 4Fe-4S dicluster domain-containing protein [Candidatus Hodarchaeota archaeon]
MEGYGAPKRDPEKCVGCFACATTCPENVIAVQDVQDKRVYGTLSHDCMYCKKCEEICPQEAITVTPAFEILSFFTGAAVEDLQVQLQQCADCKTYFASPKHIELIKSKAQSTVTPQEVWKLCPSCRQQRIAEELKQAATVQASLYIKSKKE